MILWGLFGSFLVVAILGGVAWLVHSQVKSKAPDIEDVIAGAIGQEKLALEEYLELPNTPKYTPYQKQKRLMHCVIGRLARLGVEQPADLLERLR